MSIVNFMKNLYGSMSNVLMYLELDRLQRAPKLLVQLAFSVWISTPASLTMVYKS